MVRVSRRKVKEQNENIAPATKSQKSNPKRTPLSDKSLKAILCDKTNINSHNKDAKKANKVLKVDSSAKKQNKANSTITAKSELNLANNISRLKETPNNRNNRDVKNGELKTDKKLCSPMNNLEPMKRNLRSNKKEANSSVKDAFSTPKEASYHNKNSKPILNVDKGTWDDFEKSFSKTLNGTEQPKSNKQNNLPVYKRKKSSLVKKSDTVEDRLNLYEFEVDENEPVAKKTKRKPILKFKKYRARKKPAAIKPVPPLNVSNQENICPNAAPEKVKSTPLAYSEKMPDSFEPDDVVLNDSVINGNTSIDYGLTKRYAMYSPKPYQSPMRESLNVPILRGSISQTNLSDSGKSPFTSRSINSSHNMSGTSQFNGHLISPMYMGSSTPIRCHWADHSNGNNTQCGNFDLTNNFGFEANDTVDEPFVSPIKTYQTPAKPASQRKASPVKIPHKQVIKMLKFGPDVPDETPENERSPKIDELLPTDFFRDGDSPSFSPPSSPIPFEMKKDKKKNKKGTKKHVTIKEHLDDSDYVSHLSDKTNQDVTAIEQTARVTRSNHDHPLTENSYNNMRNTRRHVPSFNDDTNGIENSTVFEIETSPVKKKPIAKPRRSYERPPYLQGRRKFEDHYHYDSEEENVIENETIKKPKKKKNDLSKKEQLELDKWAKAFNEQCMQVESFSLVVE